MVDAIVMKIVELKCSECENLLDTCVICSENFIDSVRIKCTTEGHVHEHCLE